MAFSWEKCIERANKNKERRDKRKVLQSKSFLLKVGVKEARKLLK